MWSLSVSLFRWIDAALVDIPPVGIAAHDRVPADLTHLLEGDVTGAEPGVELEGKGVAPEKGLIAPPVKVELEEGARVRGVPIGRYLDVRQTPDAGIEYGISVVESSMEAETDEILFRTAG